MIKLDTVGRFAVTGGRASSDAHLALMALSRLPRRAVLVHGDATGADQLCANLWRTHGDLHAEAHPADWSHCRATCAPNHRRLRANGDTYCPMAGFYRNQEMVDSGLDVLLAFPGGRRTADMTWRSELAGVPVVRAVDLLARS